MTRVWRARKGYLKLHALDVRTKQVVSMEVIADEVGDGRIMRSLVEGAEGRVEVGRLLADGAYDSGENLQPQLLGGEGDRTRHRGEEELRPQGQGMSREEKGAWRRS
jgi:hypothetical protein